MPAPQTTLTGGCRCGKIRFKITAEPVIARICWCRDCQYFAAGSPTVNVVFPSDQVTITGDPAEYQSLSDSGNLMVRRFCPHCGTPLFSAAQARPHLIIVRAGALDNPDIAKPTMSIWAASAPQWACIDPNIPAIAGQPPPIT